MLADSLTKSTSQIVPIRRTGFTVRPCSPSEQRLIDVLERVVPDESIKGEPPFGVQRDQFGNEDMGIRIALNDAARHASAAHDRGGVEAELGARRTSPDQAQYAARTECVGGGGDGARAPRGIDCIVEGRCARLREGGCEIWTSCEVV